MSVASSHQISTVNSPSVPAQLVTKATRIAIQEMIDFLVATKGLDTLAAYQLTSVAGNVVITQLVDQKVGVHVKMPKEIFRK